jgi:integrase
MSKVLWGFEWLSGELIEVTTNPMRLVKVKDASKRQEEPVVLTKEQFHTLLKHLPEEPFKTMVLTAMSLGLRCSELLGLKWSDFDWEDLTLLVQRAIVDGRVDAVKTKYSKTQVPLDPGLGEVLLNWKLRSQFNQESDWVFASPFSAGQMPYQSWGVQRRRIKPAAIQAGIGAIGWHTFRHSYRSWLDETGAPMKVQQELMRHADIRTTMNIYGAAMSESKREANSKVVQMVLDARRKGA